jgi:uncharacterized protein
MPKTEFLNHHKMTTPLYLPALLFSLLLSGVGSAWAQTELSAETQAVLAKAKAGDLKAQLEIAEAYDYGKGAPQDEKEALRWYQAAGSQGSAEAQNSAGSLLLIRKDFGQAFEWFEKASKQNHAQAINSLAYLHDTGQGTKQDRTKGFELYTRAANLGWAESMWNLANMYGVGLEGAKPDYPNSCAWTIRAARHVEDPNSQVLVNIQKALPIFEKLLTPEQQTICKKQGEEWKAPNAPPQPK